MGKEHKNIFFISDTHFWHEGALKFEGRTHFSSVEEMNETIISNWNARVKGNDRVYIMGDMFYKADPADVEEVLSRLKGKMYLIRGNHDGSWIEKIDYKKYFVEVAYMLEDNDGQRALTLCHYPLLIWKHQHKSYMIHGHLHVDTTDDFWPLIRSRERVLNAAVEINGFAPVTFDELVENNRIFKENHP